MNPFLICLFLSLLGFNSCIGFIDGEHDTLVQSHQDSLGREDKDKIQGLWVHSWICDCDTLTHSVLISEDSIHLKFSQCYIANSKCGQPSYIYGYQIDARIDSVTSTTIHSTSFDLNEKQVPYAYELRNDTLYFHDYYARVFAMVKKNR